MLIEKDSYGNKCIGFKILDFELTSKLMTLINLEACKQMLNKKHFKAAMDNVIKYAWKKKLLMVINHLINGIGLMIIIKSMNLNFSRS